jgi:hypothetical protein
MEMEITEKITVKIPLKEVFDLVTKELRENGYEVNSISLDYEKKIRNVGQFPFGGSEEYKELIGVIAEVNRRKGNE